MRRVAEIALLVNGGLETIAGTMFLFGRDPLARESPLLASLVAACFYAGVFMMVFVSRRLRRDAGLIWLPLVYVVTHLTDTVYRFVTTGNVKEMAPAFFEASFLAIYSSFAVTQRRFRGAPP